MKAFDDDPETVSAFHPTVPSVPSSPAASDDGSISAFRSGDTSAMRALETIVEPGTVIGGYTIGKLIGRGGIAAVYNAERVSDGLTVAVKVLDARFTGSPEVVNRFLGEAETLSLFNHPNIVHYLDHGQDETFVYLAMEYVPGITLDQLAHAIKLEPHHYARLAHEISKGLTCVHAQGMVHGDIKPSNILVTRPGDVKLSDFGAAAREAIKGSRVAQGKVHGTSAFMAPELFKPLMGVDHRADIFSLAVTFYKVFTGKLPGSPYAPPSALNPELPAEVDAVIERGLRSDPDERFVTAKEFCDALAATFDATELTTPVAISPDPAAQPVEGHPDAPAGTAPDHGIRDSDLPPAAAAASKSAARDGIDWRLVVACGAVGVVVAVALVIWALG